MEGEVSWFVRNHKKILDQKWLTLFECDCDLQIATSAVFNPNRIKKLSAALVNGQRGGESKKKHRNEEETDLVITNVIEQSNVHRAET